MYLSYVWLECVLSKQGIFWSHCHWFQWDICVVVVVVTPDLPILVSLRKRLRCHNICNFLKSPSQVCTSVSYFKKCFGHPFPASTPWRLLERPAGAELFVWSNLKQPSIVQNGPKAVEIVRKCKYRLEIIQNPNISRNINHCCAPTHQALHMYVQSNSNCYHQPTTLPRHPCRGFTCKDHYCMSSDSAHVNHSSA